ncbi:cytochrome P450 [Mycena epipterygia]|nr:cytochrome P450 [Mycena epipterygia]
MSEDIPENERLSDAVVAARATATTWALYTLARHQDVQATLRTELLAMGTENPSLDAQNALPYLDKVMRETGRVIPFGTPYTLGVKHEDIAVTKSQSVWIPIAALNRDPRVWGATSLNSNNCIGWRFSLAEMKSLLCTLVRTFEFKLAVPAEEWPEARSTSAQSKRNALAPNATLGPSIHIVLKPGGTEQTHQLLTLSRHYYSLLLLVVLATSALASVSQ